MFLRLKTREYRSGTTLSETLSASVVLAIIVVGATGYRYHSTLDARWSNEQVTAARLAELACASWAGVEGDQSYNPIAHLGSVLTIDASSPPNGLPKGFALLGSYRITVDGVAYGLVLSWSDVSTELWALRVRVEWDWRAEDPSNPLQLLRKSFTIITYVSR